MKKQKSSSSIIMNKGIIILISAIVVLYLGTAIYFKNHFYLGSKINGISVSGMTVEKVEDKLKSQFQSYSLTLNERNDLTEVISADDISLTYNSEGKIKEFKDKQSSLGWIFGIFSTKSTELTDLITFDDDKLTKKLNNLEGITSKNVVKPKSASVQYENGEFVIVNEVQGNTINLDSLTAKVNDAIKSSTKVIDLDQENCYEKPKYVSTDSEVEEAKEQLQKYASSSITYTFGSDSETLDGEKISKWLSTDDDLNVIFDENQVKKYVLNLAYKYNTSNITRSFKATSGSNINVVPGDYGWRIDTSQETSELINNIKDGQTITKEPIYAQKAANHTANDIGDTYVEVSLSGQHLWFYKNGSLVIDSDVVTGNISAGHGTPAGVYMLKYKEKDATLKGENYTQPVSYWMPFNNGIGLHDANWRNGVFGGNIYTYEGSHGCVNLPPEVAKTIYQNIEAGTAVVLY